MNHDNTAYYRSRQVVHQAANILASLEFIDQVAAQQIGPMAEAVANMFMVVYYQAETGRATPADFQEAMDGLKQALPVTAGGGYGS
ncbi:type I toxin-antitoxin system ptaRNA1 family toxin [Pseudomonas aeruginosa]|nr:type I toxin-antitoxin system ptaRNA1 family toxin [Klebsiella grimontii]